ncbi:MAG: aspartate aminotransferase family protein [Microscillaceae bacterium]|nr:aspartate aminotransferase family protein [Microscillaceae bacterium]
MLSPRQIFLNHIAQTSDTPLMIEVERAEGVYFYAPEGKAYLDLISGIGVSHVGHRHPKVLEAIQKQLDKYLHVMVYGELIQSPQNLFAQKITAHLPESLSNVYFVNSGAEAIDGAMKLAKRFTGKTEFVSCYKSYHGSLQGALSLGDETFKQAYRPLLPGIHKMHYGSFSDLEKVITPNTAAVIIEAVQGEAGVISACKPYFQALRRRCDQTGTLLILDEVQTGFGRTGKLWGFEHLDIVPDILVLAKGMGGGMPIGAFISSSEKMAVLKNNPILGHITTFGGHPLCCAAGLASMEVILEEKLYEEAENKAQLFKKYLKHPKIREIRHKGLMMALIFDNFAQLKKIIDRAIERGVLTDWFLYCDHAMRIAPPLIIQEDEIRQACELLLEAIDD